MIATGMLTQKMARQSIAVRYPPASGPTDVSPPVTAKKIAMALPRSPTGNEATTIASAAGNMTAAAPPWTTRQKMIQASARSPEGVAPQRAEAAAKATTPITTMRRCPAMSARRPPKANNADRASR
jgi:hypothetical protein